MLIPTKSIFMADDGEYDVPPEWELRFAHAEVLDYRSGEVVHGVFRPSWGHRQTVQADFELAIRKGRISKVEAS